MHRTGASPRGIAYAALRPLTVFEAFAAARRTFASARLTTCLPAFENWSKAAVVAAIVDLNALMADYEPAGADLAAVSTHDAMPFV